MCIMDVVAGACYLCWLLQGLCGEAEVATLVQVVIVHALGDLGNGIIAGQPLYHEAFQPYKHPQACKTTRYTVRLVMMVMHAKL